MPVSGQYAESQAKFTTGYKLRVLAIFRAAGQADSNA